MDALSIRARARARTMRVREMSRCVERTETEKLEFFGEPPNPADTDSIMNFSTKSRLFFAPRENERKQRKAKQNPRLRGGLSLVNLFGVYHFGSGNIAFFV